ncbi:MAG: hypothetical protein ACI9CD_000901 [Candidatus Deianiraeaceae bacterium]|jgi:hypothetical protein
MRRNVYLVIISILFSGVALAGDVVQKQYALVKIIDKLYADVIRKKIEINEVMIHNDITISVTQCIKNEKDQIFAMLKIKDEYGKVFHKWVSTQEYNLTPLQHVRFDVTVQQCDVNAVITLSIE